MASTPLSKANHGFTLIELSIVLVIIALIVASGMSMGQSALESAKLVATNNRLDAIERALIAYRLAHDRLPCPADATLAHSDAQFGVEGVNPGLCITGSTYDVNGVRTAAASPGPTANTTFQIVGLNDVTDRIAEGAIPIKALNLPEEAMLDGWGRRISYAVWTPATKVNAFLLYGIKIPCGGITVNNAAAAARTTAGVYSLVSFGSNGHGAYLPGGARVNANSANTDEQTNCHCNADLSSKNYTATYVQKDATVNSSNSLDSFDDLVRYRERWQMQNMYDTYHPAGNQTCPSPGFRVDDDIDTPSGDQGVRSIAVGDVNGDGIADLIIGSPVDTIPGTVYVLFGSATSGFVNPLRLSTLNGINGFKMVEQDQFGPKNRAILNVATGNILGHGDKTVDIVISTYGDGGYGFGGQHILVIRGGAFGAASYNLDSSDLLDGTKGFSIDEDGSGGFGYGLAVGDVNGDGVDDIMIQANTGSNDLVYMVFGGSCPGNNCVNGTWQAAQTLDTGFLDGPGNGVNGTIIYNDVEGQLFGAALATGKIHSSSINDLIIGVPYRTGVTYKGAVYVLYGRATWPDPFPGPTIANLDAGGSQGFRMDGESNYMLFGTSIAVGNLSGRSDGLQDMVIGAPNYNYPTRAVGSAYVLFGKSSWGASNTVALSGLINGLSGFRLDGETVTDGFGTFVATGDISGHGNGTQDVMIAAPSPNPSLAYLVFGGTTEKNGSPWPTSAQTINPTFLNGGGTGVNGFRMTFNAVDNDYIAIQGLVAADINGDQKADIIVAKSDFRSSLSGLTYIYFGQQKASWDNPYNLDKLCSDGSC